MIDDFDKFTKTAEAMKRMEDNLNKIVEAGVLADTQAALNEIAQASGSKLEDVVNLCVRMARAGVSPEELERITETVQKAFPVGGE